jgi:glycosyltransferase involved in cell wall biosynthesis
MARIAVYLTSMELGGAQRIALNLCAGLADKGYTVDLVLVDANGELLGDLPTEVSVVDLGANRIATSLLSLRQYLRRRRPDVLYSMMTECNVIATVAHRTARIDTQLVVSEHNTPTASASTWKDQFVLRLATRAYPYANHVVTVSEGVRNDLLNLVDIDPNRVSVIYNPIDVGGIREQAQKPLVHEWFHDESLDVILSAGRHAPQKGFDTLLRAVARLDGERTRLVLLGRGPQTEALRSLADDLGISARVDFTGFVDNPFKYMANADVFVLSSWYEGFGNVLIEAMATGCPVVSTDCPSGPREILAGGQYGRLVPVKNPQKMSNGIQFILLNPPEVTTLRARADEFSVPKITEQYVRIFFEPG